MNRRDWDVFLEQAWAIPDWIAHFLGVLAATEDQAEDEAYAKYHERLWWYESMLIGRRTTVVLVATIETIEHLLFELGRRPFKVEDQQRQLWTLARLIGYLCLTARELGPDAIQPLLPRLRGIDAQLELRWPRIGGLHLLRQEVGFHEDGGMDTPVLVYGGRHHPLRELRQTLVDLGDTRDADVLGGDLRAELDTQYTERADPDDLHPGWAREWRLTPPYADDVP